MKTTRPGLPLVWFLLPSLLVLSALLLPLSLARAEELDLEKFKAQLKGSHAKEVLNEISKFKDTHAEDPEFLAVYGHALFAAGENSTGREVSLEVLEKDNKHVYALNNLGSIAVNSGDFRTAYPFYMQAAELAPDDPRTNYNLGTYYLKLGENSKAVGYFEKALQQNKRYYYAYVNLADAYKNLGEYQKQLEVSEAGFAQFQDTPEIYSVLGNAYLEVKRSEDAERVYAEGEKLFPEDYQLPYHLGIAAATNGKFELAEKSYLRSIELAPGFARPYINLAQIYEKQNRNKEAITLLENIKQYYPDEYRIHDQLFRLYLKIGDKPASDRELAEAQRINPVRAQGKSFNTLIGILAGAFLGLIFFLRGLYSLLRKSRRTDGLFIMGGGIVAIILMFIANFFLLQIFFPAYARQGVLGIGVIPASLCAFFVGSLIGEFIRVVFVKNKSASGK